MTSDATKFHAPLSLLVQSQVTAATKVLHWEDLGIDRHWEAGPALVTEEAIIAFAEEFDPLPMHLSPEMASESALGIFCASGAHVFAIGQRLLCEAVFLRSAVVAGGAVDDFKMRAPVVPGDQLVLSAHVVDRRPHQTRQNEGWAVLSVSLRRADRRVVLSYRITVLFRRHAAPRQRDSLLAGRAPR